MPAEIVQETPPFRTDYELVLVEPEWLQAQVKPKQFIHIDQAECILCEGCVDICPWKCIHLLTTDIVEESKGIRKPGDDNEDKIVFVIDEDECTRCALCVDRCPTGVIILGKLGPAARGDQHARNNNHGYAYGMRF